VADKRIKPCGTACAPKQDPLDIRTKMGRSNVPAPQVLDVPKPGPDMLIGRRNIDAFWEALPWGDSQVYFSREAHILYIAAGGVYQVDNFTIPRGMVLAITEVYFRTKADVAGAHQAYMRDDFWCGRSINTEALAFFYPTISSRAFGERTFRYNTINLTRSGYTLLNTNIATSEVPYVVFAKEGQTVSLTFDLSADAPAAVGLPAQSKVGVEWGGLWIPKKLYDQLKEKFNG